MAFFCPIKIVFLTIGSPVTCIWRLLLFWVTFGLLSIAYYGKLVNFLVAYSHVVIQVLKGRQSVATPDIIYKYVKQQPQRPLVIFKVCPRTRILCFIFNTLEWYIYKGKPSLPLQTRLKWSRNTSWLRFVCIKTLPKFQLHVSKSHCTRAQYVSKFKVLPRP